MGRRRNPSQLLRRLSTPQGQQAVADARDRLTPPAAAQRALAQAGRNLDKREDVLMDRRLAEWQGLSALAELVGDNFPRVRIEVGVWPGIDERSLPLAGALLTGPECFDVRDDGTVRIPVGWDCVQALVLEGTLEFDAAGDVRLEPSSLDICTFLATLLKRKMTELAAALEASNAAIDLRLSDGSTYEVYAGETFVSLHHTSQHSQTVRSIVNDPALSGLLPPAAEAVLVGYIDEYNKVFDLTKRTFDDMIDTASIVGRASDDRKTSPSLFLELDARVISVGDAWGDLARGRIILAQYEAVPARSIDDLKTWWQKPRWPDLFAVLSRLNHDLLDLRESCRAVTTGAGLLTQHYKDLTGEDVDAEGWRRRGLSDEDVAELVRRLSR
jgi:hypothetical protein